MIARTISSSFSLFLLCLLLSGCGSRPSDEMLIRNFQENREAFQSLFHQFNNEKGIEKISLDSISPKNAEISDEKLNRYRMLLKELGVLQIYKINLKDSHRIFIHFFVYSRGLSITGESKSYLYATEKPGLLVENLDDYYIQRRKTKEFLSYVAYRYITDNWYLCHDVDD